MIYKFSDIIQTHDFHNYEEFVLDLEETFNAIISEHKDKQFKTLHIVAPTAFIKDVFYYLIMSPHLLADVVTRFSLFEEYTIEELIRIFNNEKNDTLMFSICEDRVCFIEELNHLKNGIMDSECDVFDFVYLHGECNYKYLSELQNKNVPTLIFDIDENIK